MLELFPVNKSHKERGRNMDQKIIELVDEYTHELFDRREFIKRLAVLTGGTAAASPISAEVCKDSKGFFYGQSSRH
jgi:hypothetical protein